MTLIQAITKAQKLTQTTGRQYVVLEELFERHASSYHVTEGISWLRHAEQSPQNAARYRRVYPEAMG